MRLRVILFSVVILTVLFLSGFESPAAPQTVKLQDTVVPPGTAVSPNVTVVPATVIATVVVPGTPVVPVTGTEPSATLWTVVLFGLLALLGIAFLVALFTPRAMHEHTDEYTDRNSPPPPDV